MTAGTAAGNTGTAATAAAVVAAGNAAAVVTGRVAAVVPAGTAATVAVAATLTAPCTIPCTALVETGFPSVAATAVACKTAVRSGQSGGDRPRQQTES